MPENVLKFSTTGDNDQCPNMLPDRHKMAEMDIVTNSPSKSSDM